MASKLCFYIGLEKKSIPADTTTQTELTLIDSNGKRFECFIARGWSKNPPKKFLGDGWDRFRNFQQLRDGDVCVLSMEKIQCNVLLRFVVLVHKNLYTIFLSLPDC